MKLRVDRKAFAAALAMAAAAIPARPFAPELGGVRLTAGDGTLTADGWDYDVAVTERTDATVDDPGQVLLPGRLRRRSAPPGRGTSSRTTSRST